MDVIKNILGDKVSKNRKHFTMTKQTDPFWQFKGGTMFDNISPSTRNKGKDYGRLALLLNDKNEESLEKKNKEDWKERNQKKRISDEMPD